ncbi:hypothetical protein VNO80_01909 [Phaseolus coccineus]|uniref:BHLH domain-containing protein n=1 Tax=Phaseolus coccineus TaxID=3886 RepID=A0AAN9RTA1_PHACN
MAKFVSSFPNFITIYINYTTVHISMDKMDDESGQKLIPILENNDWPIFSDFDMNSVGEELKGDDSSVDPEEVSWKESTATLLSNFLSLEDNTGFDMTTLTQHASPHKPQTCVLSFEDSTSVKKTCQHLGEQSKQTQEEKPHNIRKPLKRERTSPQTLDHIITERKRRENITRMFIALAALIPGLKKMDKVSVLSNAVEYVKCLQQRVKDLEKEKQKRKIESVGCLKLSKTNMVAYDLSWSSHVYDGEKATKKCSKVEARVAGKDVLIRVTCEMQKNIVRDVMAKLQAHNLSILSCNVLPFGNSALAITTIAEMNPEFTMAMEDLLKKLNDDLSKCCNLQY